MIANKLKSWWPIHFSQSVQPLLLCTWVVYLQATKPAKMWLVKLEAKTRKLPAPKSCPSPIDSAYSHAEAEIYYHIALFCPCVSIVKTIFTFSIFLKQNKSVTVFCSTVWKTHYGSTINLWHISTVEAPSKDLRVENKACENCHG